MLLPVSRALVGHGVFSALLGRPAGRLGASGAGLSGWRGGVRRIVLPSLQLFSTGCFEALLMFLLTCGRYLVVGLLAIGNFFHPALGFGWSLYCRVFGLYLCRIA